MKKLLCFLLCSVLIFSSVSLCFAADWSQTEINSVVNNVSSINTTLNNIYNRLGTISNALFDSNHSVAYWVSAIDSWMQPIYQSLTSNLAVNIGLDITNSLLGYPTTVEGGGTTWTPYLLQIRQASDVLNVLVQTFSNNFTAAINVNNTLLQNIRDWGFSNYNTTQNAVNWGNLNTSSFTPSSATDGLYKWLSAIQAPVARLSYVLASDERIEAQEAAAANEDAVVDNFIDSTGDGSASPSDFGSVSGLSSGYKQNFGSDASPSGIFDIFNSDHATWFSQETKNQLDTTTPSRLSKGSASETPLLDKQIEDIYNALGVKQP